MNDTADTLGTFVRDLMEERGLSGRAVSMYAEISQGALNDILHDKGNPKPVTLNKLSEFFSIPVETLYRLAGYLPKEDIKAQAIREAEYLLRQLPPEKQREMLEMIRTIHRLYTEQSAQTGELEETQETG